MIPPALTVRISLSSYESASAIFLAVPEISVLDLKCSSNIEMSAKGAIFCNVLAARITVHRPVLEK